MSSHDLDIQYIAVAALTPWAANARTHSKKQIRQIAASITEFGFTNPLLIDKKNNVLAGHGRLAAAKQLGMQTVPCVRLESLTEAQKRAYVLADNKLALNAGWGDELLAQELQGLLGADCNFDLALTGFSVAEVDFPIDGLNGQDSGDLEDDVLPAIGEGEARCRLGDIWSLGPHRLICGNALDTEIVAALMDGQKTMAAWVASTDPVTNWCLPTRTARPLTSTTSSWASTAAIEPMSGSTAV